MPAKQAAEAVPGSSQEHALTVSALNAAIRDTVEGFLPPVWLAGEVSSFKVHQGGHWYFTLKDVDGSSLDCVIWSSQTAAFPAQPEIGMRVFAFGQLSVWVKTNRVQFKVRKLEDQGEGIWRKAFEKTRAALERDGLLDPARKRAIPRFPRTVGVITSASGAAVHDIVSVIRRRNRAIHVVIIPAAVQGDGAAESLVAALARAARWREADVLIVGRGGGSREDLWCFNDERVARALAASPIPTVSAVGHESDVTIADFVADLRAPTPSAAAELVAPLLDDLARELARLHRSLIQGLERRASDGRKRLARAVTGLVGRGALMIERRRARVERSGDLRQRVARLIQRRRDRVASLSATLNALSPLAVLGRGYAAAFLAAGGPLVSVGQVSVGAALRLVVRDGDLDATVGAVRAQPGREHATVPRSGAPA
ncbi:MAG: exodeoxyribonuclease VII large subunit [Gemmatimonadetes bacterium]|nr:exodeoxyribonuclease VII large subunit [Gemmatimonadota bacterium]